LSEEEILAVYEDLLAPPIEEKADVQAEEDGSALAIKTVTEVANRLFTNLPEITSNAPLYQTLLDRLEELTSTAQIDVACKLIDAEETEKEPKRIAVPVSGEEWRALIRVAVSLCAVLRGFLFVLISIRRRTQVTVPPQTGY
jgi:hypothetical protein